MRYILIILISATFFEATYAQKKVVNFEKKMLVISTGTYKPFFVTKSNKPLPVKAFRMDETAVTNLEFLEFVKYNPDWRKSKVNRLFADTNYLRHWENDLSIGISNQDIYHSPVVNVSWFAVQSYCKWKNKRLPTIAEWEIAGMGAPKNIKYSSLTDYILNWYKRPNLPVLPNVKSTYQNIYGLYDMHGLIWEWTSNFNSYVTSMDSRGNNSDDQKLFCAAGSLNVVDKTDYAGYLRFRCAKNIN